MIEQRADTDHHQIFARREDFLRQFRDDSATGGFDNQIGGGDQFDQRQIRRRIFEHREKLARAFFRPAGYTGDAHRKLARFGGLNQRLADRPATHDTNGLHRPSTVSLIYREGFSAVNATAPTNRASNKRSLR